MCPATVIKCEVCSDKDSKYKCPQCLVRYCSLGCFKSHKEACRKKSDGKLSDVNQKSLLTDNLVESEDRVSIEALERLGDSEQLLQLLRNPHLRNIISDVDSSVDPASSLHKVMQEPIFAEFADQCIKIVDSQQSGTGNNGI